jgi:hypothetical protein
MLHLNHRRLTTEEIARINAASASFADEYTEHTKDMNALCTRPTEARRLRSMCDVQQLQQLCECALCAYFTEREFSFEPRTNPLRNEWRWRAAMFEAQLDLGREVYRRCCTSCVIYTEMAARAGLPTENLGLYVVYEDPTGQIDRLVNITQDAMPDDTAIGRVKRNNAILGLCAPFARRWTKPVALEPAGARKRKGEEPPAAAAPPRKLPMLPGQSPLQRTVSAPMPVPPLPVVDAGLAAVVEMVRNMVAPVVPVVAEAAPVVAPVVPVLAEAAPVVAPVVPEFIQPKKLSATSAPFVSVYDQNFGKYQDVEAAQQVAYAYIARHNCQCKVCEVMVTQHNWSVFPLTHVRDVRRRWMKIRAEVAVAAPDADNKCLMVKWDQRLREVVQLKQTRRSWLE